MADAPRGNSALARSRRFVASGFEQAPRLAVVTMSGKVSVHVTGMTQTS